MKKKAKNILKNISSTVLANVIGTIVSIMTNLIVPKLLGIESYGYWQLYVLYIGYVGIIGLGWNEGVYLKLGGKRMTDLQEQKIVVQLKFFSAVQLMISILISTVLWLFKPEKYFIYITVALMILPSNIKNFSNYILLATNEIQSYALVTIIDRIVFLLGIFWCFISGRCDIWDILAADCLARISSALVSLFKIRPSFHYGEKLNWEIVKDIKDSIFSGNKLLFSNLAGTLIIGIVKMVVGWRWDITTFGQVSFTISITNLVLVLINAIGITLFPILKNISKEQLVKVYTYLRTLLSFAMIVCLFFYFPLKEILMLWLPDYEISLQYMGLIFPLIIYETRTAMLLNTYFKALRFEKMLLIGNVLSLGFSFTASMISVYIIGSINMAVMAVLSALMFRGMFLEAMLGKKMDISEKKESFMELMISIGFIVAATCVGGYIGAALYGVILFVYSLIHLPVLKNIIGQFRMI